MAGIPANKGRIVAVSIGHLFNDWYINYIQTLLPFLVAAGLGISKGAFLVSAFTVTSSLLQPLFGLLADRKDRRWMVYIGTLWTALLLSLVGLLKSYTLLVFVVSLAGLGNAAFHPQASAMIDSASGVRKGFYQSVFMACGNVGFALTPLMAVPFIQAYGLSATPLLATPGILAALLQWFMLPKDAEPVAQAKAVRRFVCPDLRRVWQDLLKIVSVVVCRSVSYFGLVSFLPVYLLEKNIPHLTGSRLLFMMLFSGALGGLLGGYLSDIFGRKRIIAGSLLMTCPLFYLFLACGETASYVFLSLAGCCLMSSFSVTVVATQEILKDNAAMAAGLMLGFGIGMGGMGVGLFGLLAEQKGVDFVVHFLMLLPLLAGLLALRLRSDNHVKLGLDSGVPLS